LSKLVKKICVAKLRACARKLLSLAPQNEVVLTLGKMNLHSKFDFKRIRRELTITGQKVHRTKGPPQ